MVEILNEIIIMLGIATFSLIVMFTFLWVCYWVIKLLNERKKIKCLCKHEFEIEYITDFTKSSGDSKRVYDLKCRKCGKKQCIVIYLKEESDLI